MTAPFRQIPFDALPDRPRVPHGWHLTERREAVEALAGFGRMRVHWREHGAGPPLLLVHGLMTHAWSWRYVVEALGRRYRVIAPDLPGCGASEGPDVHYGPRALAEWIGAFQRARGIRGCRVIGNSMGGYLCMWLALQDPGAMSALVNLHSPGVPLKRLWALRTVLRLPGSGRLLRALVHRDPERWVHRNVHYYDESLKSREEARTWAEPLRSGAGIRAFHRYLGQALDPAEMAAFVAILRQRGTLGVPTLLLYAARDPMVPPAVGDALRALLPSARFERLVEASHFAHVDAPDRFLAPTLDFLEASC